MDDINDKITGGTLTANEWNQVPSEIQNVIEGLGIALSGADLNQLGKAIAGYVANGTFYTDSGAANAYVLSVIGLKQNPTAYTNGFEAEFIVGNTNTVASTVNVAGLGNVDISGTATAGTLTTGDIVRMRFNLGTGDFDIVNNTGADIAASSVSFVNSTTGLSATNVQAALDESIGANEGKVVVTKLSFDGTGTPAIKESINVSSITDVGVGRWDINLTSALPSTNGVIVSSAGDDDDISRALFMKIRIATTTVVEIDIETPGAVQADVENISFAIFGGT